MVLQSVVSQLSVIKRQFKSYCRMKSWISSLCFTADLVLISAHEMGLGCGERRGFLIVDRRSILNSHSIIRAFLAMAGNIAANRLRFQMVSAEYCRLTMFANHWGGGGKDLQGLTESSILTWSRGRQKNPWPSCANMLWQGKKIPSWPLERRSGEPWIKYKWYLRKGEWD